MRKLSRKFTSAVLTLALLVSLLPIGAAPAQAAETRAIVGAFEVTGNSSNYSYNDGVLTVNDGVLTVNDGADITISMANGATTPTSDRIVVNGNAEITLNGVNITGAAYDSINGTDAQSPIDVSENATLILNLPESSQNTLIGGEGKASVGAPGIHVPDSASLVIHGKGVLSVTGGASTNAYGGNGIGGISFGGSSGSVIIFATGKVTITGGDGQGTTSDGVDIGGGLGTTDGGNGQGIRPVSGQENTYTVWGNLTLPCDITIPQGATVTIPDGASLTVPSGTKLTNNGTISVQGGAFSGEVSGTQPIAAAGYTINYADETITASNGYELSATNTETAEESQTLNLTHGEDVYIRLAELEGASWVTVDIPARPAAPAVTATIDYSGEKLSFPSDVTETTLEYALSQSNPNWKDVPSGAALSEMEWDGNAEKSYYFRTGATDSAFASSATTTSITAPARPAAPNDLNLMDYTDVSVTYYVGEGVQCRLGNEGA